MLDKYSEVFHQLFSKYQEGERKDLLKNAKDSYLSMTGKINEDSPYFETKMNAFNEWFVFNYQEEGSREKVIERFLQESAVEKEMVESFSSIRYSLFEYSKNNLRGQIVLTDLLTDDKVVLAKGHDSMGIYKGELLICRIVTYQGENFMLRGVFGLPTAVNSLVKKQCKLVKKSKVDMTPEEFLLKLEGMKSKAITYAHIEPIKFFQF